MRLLLSFQPRRNTRQIGKVAPNLCEKTWSWERSQVQRVARTLGVGPGTGMSRADYYWRQADLCMRLSLLSDDNEVADLLINKALELLSQAERAAEEEVRSGRTAGHDPPALEDDSWH
jgi:hypothetical protein